MGARGMSAWSFEERGLRRPDELLVDVPGRGRGVTDPLPLQTLAKIRCPTCRGDQLKVYGTRGRVRYMACLACPRDARGKRATFRLLLTDPLCLPGQKSPPAGEAHTARTL